MIGARIDLEWDRFDYVYGLLVDEGLVPDEDFMAAGAATVVVTEDAWGRLDAEAQAEVARFMRPTSEVEVRAVPEDSVARGNGTDSLTEELVTDEGAH